MNFNSLKSWHKITKGKLKYQRNQSINETRVKKFLELLSSDFQSNFPDL